MGLDRLTRVAPLVVGAALLSGCDDDGGRPDRLLYGEAAQELTPVPNSVVTIGRALYGTTLGRRFGSCRPEGVSNDATVVERIGVFGESLTFADADGKTLYSCDGGADPAHERKPPWCGSSAGRLVSGRLLDPRLDVLCRDRDGDPLAYAWVEPVPGARWIGVDQGSYTELYEVVGDVPVRVACKRDIQLEQARATFQVSQYDVHGNPLIKGKLEAAVSG
jgi:hypothetical protein